MDPIARLVAIEEIRQLKSRYFRTLDTHDWAGMAEVFCRDATFDCSEGFRVIELDGTVTGFPAPVKHGRDQIMAWIVASCDPHTSCHHGHCHEVTIDSETEAHGVIAMEDQLFKADRVTRTYRGAGHYTEQYRFEDGAWRIASTKLTRLFSHYLASEPPRVSAAVAI
jgi:hypothetical protein